MPDLLPSSPAFLLAFLAAAATSHAQPLSWSQLQISRRGAAAMAYDMARAESVLFGGSTGTANGAGIPSGELWTWNGSSLVLRSTNSAVARYSHAMAFDAARCESIISGGYQSTFVTSTWAWNGFTWTQRSPSGAEDNAAMAYDSTRRVSVVFGGWHNGLVSNNSTIEWNGNSWSFRSSTGPSARYDHAMAYDPLRGVTLLFGGEIREGITSHSVGETWEWNGSTWTRRMVPEPLPRSGHKLAFDARRGVIVLVGSGYGTGDAHVWEWDGNAWSQRPLTATSPTFASAMAYDSIRGFTVVYNEYTNSIWEWDGTDWNQRTSITPGSRYGHAMVYDSSRDKTVVFGGYSLGPDGLTNVPNAETWEWNGSAWAQSPATGPSARYYHAMVHDAARGETVLFGGLTSVPNGETWRWNGAQWTQSPAAGPPARYGHAMAYDAARQVVVLFGGRSNIGGFNTYGDTWEWNGLEWTMRSDTGPAPRFFHAMAYDATRARTVLFGGSAAGLNGETWEWDGNSWTPRSVAGPSPRSGHSMAYDASRSRVVLMGDTTDARTWEWDGAAWTARTETGPIARQFGSLAYDTQRASLLLFAGARSGSPPTDDFWSLAAPCAAPLITSQPVSRIVCPSGAAAFSITANSSTSPSYIWQVRSAPNTWQAMAPDLRPLACGITTIPLASAAPFNSAACTIAIRPAPGNPAAPQTINFRCMVSNACGTALSTETAYTICPADFNCSGGLEIQDIFDFLNAWLGGVPAADFDGQNGLQVQDIFTFLNAWFAAC